MIELAGGVLEWMVVRRPTFTRRWVWMLLNGDGIVVSGKTWTQKGAYVARDRAIIERTSP